eukprot:CAMPEP_0179409800 /NCGR_PEP_ID=MMETSP0799-20121207/2912_1 /TAXON_ID=46947 /ORGANISM="Geminigera cryophila, Strain CCMP2564" /LENGTH=78 /DNA_ID=CAMNT_0021181537 /DNA_START=674 /DNA_END=910 /DNA_ORIENTATION=+
MSEADFSGELGFELKGGFPAPTLIALGVRELGARELDVRELGARALGTRELEKKRRSRRTSITFSVLASQQYCPFAQV